MMYLLELRELITELSDKCNNFDDCVVFILSCLYFCYIIFYCLITDY